MSGAMLSPALEGLLLAGIPGLAALAVVEKLVPVIPSYVLYVAIGTTMLAGPADLLWAVPVSAAAGAFAGLGWYGLGRALGPRRTRRWVARWGRYLGFDLRLYRRCQLAYRRRAFAVTLVGHSLPVVRFWLPLPAGLMGVPLAGFALASLLGGLFWNGALLGIGVAAGRLGPSPLLLGCAAVAALLLLELAAFAIWRRRRLGRLPREAPSTAQ